MRSDDALQAWDGVAAAWERHADRIQAQTAPVTKWLAATLDPIRGQTVLELAAGPGDVGVTIGRGLGNEGRLISSDFAPEMVEVARRRVAAFGLDNVEFRMVDAQAINLPDDHVDGIVCRFGLMLMPDPDAALRECRRILRAGGRLVFATWGPPERNPWITVLGLAMLQRGHLPPADPFEPGGVFSMSDPERVRTMLTGAGFSESEVGEVHITQSFASLDEYWNVQSQISGSLASTIASLSEEGRSALKDTIRESLLTFTDEGEIKLPGVAIVASAG
ncbi:MAG: class I SAM-dependent methyltransferase [Actinomycetota bacterium]